MGSKRKIAFAPEPVTASELRCVDPHPYGCLPAGNVFLSESSCNQLPLTHEIWQEVLGFSDGVTLGRVVQTCREFYVAAHQPELWRDLVLRDVQGKTLSDVGESWKDTYVKRLRKGPDVPHQPMKVPGVYSDYYYRSHLCRSFALPSNWFSIEGGSIDRVEGISIEDFLSTYESLNKPVVLAGACKNWKAHKTWGSMENLEKGMMGRTLRATSGAAPLPAQFTLRAYYDYSSNQLEEAPLYLFDRSALLEGSPLREDFYPDLQQQCPYFDPESTDHNTHDLFQFLGEGRRPDHTWLIFGPQRSGSSFHIDPNCTHAWNAAIVGRKRWLFYPPGVTPPGVHPSPDGDHVAMPISLGEWLLNYWDKHMERYSSAPPRERPLECTVEAGDIIFVPHGWWHSVVNLDPINVAITHNYVSKSNLSDVLRFLDTKVDQISGCRDREESIKPEDLHREFCKGLEEKHPNWLAEARVDAERGWTCAAWKDKTQEDEEGTGLTRKTAKKRKQSINSILAKGKLSDDDEPGGFSFSFM